MTSEQKPRNGESSGEDSEFNRDANPETEETAQPENVVDAKELENARLQKELLYQRAEFDNFRKRILREQEQAIKFGQERFVREMLPVVDLLERATAHGNKIDAKGTAVEKEFASFLQGIQMTHRELLTQLGKVGVEFLGSEGDDFNPNLHEALSQREAPAASDGKIVEVLARGSALHGRTLVPAKVVVGVAGKD